ncbi:hypothetical protein LQF76_11740 [Gloeomargaritales cyanobacterium VI4D9]|nr:hypothetical protein LQF76_11740 [Gloeomargaritales cyanobacterium VI4D9]
MKPLTTHKTPAMPIGRNITIASDGRLALTAPTGWGLGQRQDRTGQYSSPLGLTRNPVPHLGQPRRSPRPIQIPYTPEIFTICNNWVVFTLNCLICLLKLFDQMAWGCMAQEIRLQRNVQPLRLSGQLNCGAIGISVQ